jgi:hypothetical protein
MKHRSSLIPCLTVGILFITCALRGSVAIGDSNVAVGGFFSQGYLYSDNNNYPTADKGGTWDFREMAFNASSTFGEHTRVGAQLFAQRFGALGADHVILDWAVLDYNVNEAFGVRVGRVKFPKGLYGEALDLDMVRPFILLPAAVYSSVERDFAASFDGVMTYGTLNAGKSSFDYKAFFGKMPLNSSQGVAEFYNSSGQYAPGVATLGMDNVRGAQLFWNTPVQGLKFGTSYSSRKNLYSHGPFSAIPSIDLSSNIPNFYTATFSGEYVLDRWTFASEWQRESGTLSSTALPYVPKVTANVGWDAWYISVARHLGKKFEVGTYFCAMRNRYPKGGSSLPHNYSQDKVVSLRYDLNEHVLFKIEAEFINGEQEVFNSLRIPNPPAGIHASDTVLAAKTTLRF